MAVEPATFERGLAQLRARADDPVAGLYGPGSMVWRLAREKAVFLGGGAAALLQLAHPFVGEAVARHSAAMTDPLGRFERTFQHVYAMVFGDLEHALGSARRVYGVHSHISGHLPSRAGPFPAGQRYEARDEAATRWVFATLIHGSVEAWELVYGPLPEADRERYWQESRRFGLLFGLQPEELPPTWEAFVAWWDRVIRSDLLTVTPAAAAVGRRLLEPPRPALTPVFRTYAAITARLLPPHLRAPFGLEWGPAQQALAAGALRAARLAYPRLPSRIRCAPAYHEARRRLYGRRAPDRLGRAMERIVLQALLGAPSSVPEAPVGP